jgi:hypothetical protein
MVSILVRRLSSGRVSQFRVFSSLLKKVRQIRHKCKVQAIVQQKILLYKDYAIETNLLLDGLFSARVDLMQVDTFERSLTFCLIALNDARRPTSPWVPPFE